MDKLKMVLAVLQKHHFWVLCAVAVALGLTVWSLATAQVANLTRGRQETLDAAFKKMEDICAQPDHPNQRVIEATKRGSTVAAEKALAAWQKLYEEQRQNNKLPDLSDEFKVWFTAVLEGREDEIPWEYLEEYQNFIRNRFPILFFEELNVLRPKGQKGAGGEAGYGPMDAAGVRPSLVQETDGQGKRAVEVEGVVEWNQADRNRIVKAYHSQQRPTTREVLDAQENLWVYEALVRVIKNTNEGADRYNAPVKVIEALQIGKDVIGTGKNPLAVGLRLGEAAEQGAGGGSAKLDASRYVNDYALPLKKNNRPPYYDHPYAEFKMMPIRMRLVMHQTKIPKLLVECANSTMPIEVRRLRLRPGEGILADLSAVTGGASGDQTPVVLQSGGSSRKPAISLYLLIEIEGIICIYNPPPLEELGAGPAGEETADTPPGTAPETPSGTEPAPLAVPPGGTPEEPAAGAAPTPAAGPTTGGQP